MANPNPSSRANRILKMVSLPELKNVGKKAIRSLTISPSLTIPHTIHHQNCPCRNHTRIRYAPNITALDYPDLFPSEITLLTQILHVPSRPSTLATDSTPQDSPEISALIDKLPTGLKAKVPWLHSSLCPEHRRINIMPLRSIFRAFRFELEERLFGTWLPCASDADTSLSPRLRAALTNVVDVVGLWTEPAVFRKKFGRDPMIEHAYREKQCLACILSVIGSNPTTCLLLGAMVLGSFSGPSRSVRVAWCEGWLKANFGFREAGRWIGDMHGLGDALRAERQRRGGERRARIAETEMRVGGLDKLGEDDSTRRARGVVDPFVSSLDDHISPTAPVRNEMGAPDREQRDGSTVPARSMIVNPFASPLDSHSSPTMMAAPPQSPNPFSAYPPPKNSHFDQACVLCPHPQKQSPTLPNVSKVYQTKPRPPRPSPAIPTLPKGPKSKSPPHSPLSPEPLTRETATPSCAKPLPKTPLRPIPRILIPRVVPEGFLLCGYGSGKGKGKGTGESGLWARRARGSVTGNVPVEMER
ncbi:hypothetical protein BDV97DRAFT_370712 [Delphinella strobiligena]|nr:hypothetical protein BDV97DRAFT_370712 [Delphinella strobiligena]